MDEKPIVLVAARERAVRRLVAFALKPAGFTVVQSIDDGSALERAWDLQPDVFVIESPESSAETIEMVRRLRGGLSTPLLLTSTHATPTRVAAALDAGADEYMARPFSPVELTARIQSLIRRRAGRLRSGRRDIGRAVVDLATRRIARGGGSVGLARAEWGVLSAMLGNEGQVMSHSELLGAAFSPDRHDDAAGLRFSIGRLRRKLGFAAWEEGPIRTIWGIGYAFDPDGLLPRVRSRAGSAVDRAGREGGGRFDRERPEVASDPGRQPPLTTDE
jgi:DNA-binding response OmpR family regulator